MRRVALVCLTLIAICLFGLADALAQFRGILLSAPSQSASPVNFTGISMSCGGGCGFTTGTAGVVGTASATISAGSVSGTWSFKLSGNDSSGNACQDYQTGGSLSISSSGVISNTSTAPAQSYPGVCPQITQAGVSNSPFSTAFTFTGSSSGGGGVPPAAAAAGFTTVAANYDFSSPLYATFSSWMDCNDNDTSKPWHWNSWRSCDQKYIHQVNDGGTNVLAWPYLASYDNSDLNGCDAVNCQLNVRTTTQDSASCTSVGRCYPNGYYEVRTRYDVNGGFSGADYQANEPMYIVAVDTGNGHFSLEIDQPENSMSCNPACMGGNIGNWGRYGNGGIPSAPNPQWDQSSSTLPSGWSPTSYHTYGFLLTSDGSSSAWVCTYVDDILQKCGDLTYINGTCSGGGFPGPASCNQYLNRPVIIMTNGPVANGGVITNGHNYTQFNMWLHVYSCSNWNGPSGSASNMCNGSTLASGTASNGVSYHYWH